MYFVVCKRSHVGVMISFVPGPTSSSGVHSFMSSWIASIVGWLGSDGISVQKRGLSISVGGGGSKTKGISMKNISVKVQITN